MSAAVACRGLVKDYGATRGLGPLDLEIPEGSIFGLLGPNGAGKTTLLTLLAGLRRPTAGTASAGSLANIGYLEQDPRYYPWMTGRELLTMVGRLYGLGGAGLEQAVVRASAIAGLEEFAGRRVGGYSGGMQQRLGLAQAILHRPRVLLLDEPVSSLDPIGRRDLLDIIAGLRGSATVVLSTHILADVERVCDRVAILDHGRLLVVSDMDELLARYAAPVYDVDLEAADAGIATKLVAVLRRERGVVGVEPSARGLTVRTDGSVATGRRVVRALADSGAAVERFEKRRPSLEEVFVMIVDGAGSAAA